MIIKYGAIGKPFKENFVNVFGGCSTVNVWRCDYRWISEILTVEEAADARLTAGKKSFHSCSTGQATKYICDDADVTQKRFHEARISFFRPCPVQY
jgi:hypothetical protein